MSKILLVSVITAAALVAAPAAAHRYNRYYGHNGVALSIGYGSPYGYVSPYSVGRYGSYYGAYGGPYGSRYYPGYYGRNYYYDDGWRHHRRHHRWHHGHH